MALSISRTAQGTSWRSSAPSRQEVVTAKGPSGRAHAARSVLFEVVHSRVVMRASPTTSAEALGSKGKGVLVEVEEERDDGWVRLAERAPGGRACYMLVHGRAVGLGPLLRRVEEQVQPTFGTTHNLRVVGEGARACVELRGGIRMPLLGLGTGGVPGLEGEAAVRLITHAIRECGLRLIDTAADYQNEEAVGEAIRLSGVPRSELFIVTKLGPLSQGYDAARASIDRSLRRLKLQHIDRAPIMCIKYILKLQLKILSL